MRLGLGSYAMAWAIGVPHHRPQQPMDAVGLVQTAAALGVGVVQICDNLPLHLLSAAELSAVVEQAAGLCVNIEVGTRGIDIDHLRRYLAIAIHVRSPLLRVVIDTPEHRPTPDEVVSLLRPLMPEFVDARVHLAIENHDRFTSRQFAQIIERIGSPAVGICLDTVNSFGALEGPEAVVATLAPWVMNLHVKEFQVRRADHQMGFAIEGKPAGQGRLDVPWLLDQLRAAGRDPNAILEQWPPPEATVEATIVKERVWAEQSVAYLRTLIRD